MDVREQEAEILERAFKILTYQRRYHLGTFDCSTERVLDGLDALETILLYFKHWHWEAPPRG